MNNQKAIEIIKNTPLYRYECEKENQSELFKALHVAVQALEKQIAKIPTYEGDGYYQGELILDTWICPCCGKSFEVDYDDFDYCPECGQHIDHSTHTLLDDD